jgi:hypothetical protein
MNRDTLERALNLYFYHNGYEEVGLLEKSYVKKIATSKREEEIIVDACTAADTRILRDLGVEFPWRWALEDSRQHAGELQVVVGFSAWRWTGRNDTYPDESPESL